MKVGIITHYDVHNHGANLQLYATISQLKEWGVDAKALRYKKNYDFMEEGIEVKYSISLKSIPTYVKYTLKKGIGCTLYNYKKRKTLNKFRKEESLVGEYYSKAKDLDAVVIGSDEIFSLEPGLNPCFWGMGIPCDKVVSYAASFGPTTLDFIKEHRAEEFIKAGIERIDNLSVRDRNSKNIVNNYSDKEVALVCDPVLLYDFKEVLKNVKRPTKNKYCIVYSYDDNMNDEATVKAIKAYAKKRGLKIYSVGFYHKWCDKSVNVSPLEVFDWFKNAEMVFTDTFHGSVISLVSNAQFCAKVGQNKNKLQFLLEQYLVDDRRVNSFEEIEKLSDTLVNYEVVNAKKEEIRNASKRYLSEAVGLSND